MERKIINRIILFNLIIASLIILDLTIPGKAQAIKELNSIYSYSDVSGNGRSRTIDEKVILELTTGERYRIGKFPNKEYNKGTKIIIIKSIFSNNVNEIEVFEKNWEKIYVGLFSNIILLITLILTTLITLANISKSNKALNIGLVLSMFFFGIISLVYHFAF